MFPLTGLVFSIWVQSQKDENNNFIHNAASGGDTSIALTGLQDSFEDIEKSVIENPIFYNTAMDIRLQTIADIWSKVGVLGGA